MKRSNLSYISVDFYVARLRIIIVMNFFGWNFFLVKSFFFFSQLRMFCEFKLLLISNRSRVLLKIIQICVIIFKFWWAIFALWWKFFHLQILYERNHKLLLKKIWKFLFSIKKFIKHYDTCVDYIHLQFMRRKLLLRELKTLLNVMKQKKDLQELCCFPSHHYVNLIPNRFVQEMYKI